VTQYAVKCGDEIIVDYSWTCVADVIASHGAFAKDHRLPGVLLTREDECEAWAETDWTVVRRPASEDPVNSPSHYTWLGGIEVIDITEHLGFCLGNVVKYVLRADHKGKPIEDLEKAAWYLNRELQRRKRNRLQESINRMADR